MVLDEESHKGALKPFNEETHKEEKLESAEYYDNEKWIFNGASHQLDSSNFDE